MFDPRLLMTVRAAGGAQEASFDFVLDVAPAPGTPPTSGPASPPPQPGGSWAPGVSYAAGTQVTYAGSAYRCLQAHTAQAGWEPPAVPALWRRG
ncbi:hypothetical protein GCM10020358_60650 [Amorphoplanes nipponensis]